MTHFATADEPRRRLLRRAARALRAVGGRHARGAPRHRRARRQQRGDAARPGEPLRPRPPRRRDLRAGPVRRGPGRARPATRAGAVAPGWRPSSRRAGRERRLRQAVRRASAPTHLATVPIGYGDGYRRAFTNNADVLVRGRRLPLVGTVSMDNVTLDAGAEAGRRGRRRAVLIGEQDGERITAEELARRLGTINYEITCGLLPRVPAQPWLSGALARRARRARAASPAWIVGGAVRDRAARPRRSTTSTSSSTATSAAAAQRVAKAVGGPMFSLSQRVRRVAGRRARPRLARRPQPDPRRLAGRGPAAARPHRQRDRRAARGRRPRRPHRRRARTSTRGCCAWSARGAFEDDPLRVCGSRASPRPRLRDRPAPRRPRARAPPAARPRLRRAHLRRAQPPARARRAPAGIALLADVGALGVVLPEIAALRRRRAEPLPRPRRPRPHARGARGGDRARARPGRASSAPSTPSALRAVLAEPLADGLTRGTAPALGRAAARRRQAARRGSCATTARSAASPATTSRAPTSRATSSAG